MKSLVLAALLLLGRIGGETAAAQAPAVTPGENLRVYLLTFGPGDAVWERFGHNAIAVSDATTGTNIAYNWGMFSFNQPHFVARLMKGMMLYWMAGYDTNAFIDEYVRTNRSVYVQELNLTPAQRVAMRDFVEWNAREENKFYTYDYYRDNCSTRVRDAIDHVLGGALRRSLEPVRTEWTYRSHTQALTYTDPIVYTGLMLAMGPRIDARLTAWQDGFIPMQLREWVRTVKVPAADGSMQPLVAAEQTLFDANRPPPRERAPNRVWLFTLTGSVVAGALLGLWWLGHRRRAATVALALLIGVITLVIGFFGLLIALLWGLTNHVVTYGNENVLQASPLTLLLAVLAPGALLGTRARRWAAWVGLFVGGCSALGFMLQILPRFDQVNGEIIGLLLPINTALAYILWQRWRVDVSQTSTATPRAGR